MRQREDVAEDCAAVDDDKDFWEAHDSKHRRDLAKAWLWIAAAFAIVGLIFCFSELPMVIK